MSTQLFLHVYIIFLHVLLKYIDGLYEEKHHSGRYEN